MTQIISFPIQKQAPSNIKPVVSMTFTTVRNGKTVILNIAKMSKEEFMRALLGDSIMSEKQQIAQKYINS